MYEQRANNKYTCSTNSIYNIQRLRQWSAFMERFSFFFLLLLYLASHSRPLSSSRPTMGCQFVAEEWNIRVSKWRANKRANKVSAAQRSNRIWTFPGAYRNANVSGATVIYPNSELKFIFFPLALIRPFFLSYQKFIWICVGVCAPR